MKNGINTISDDEWRAEGARLFVHDKACNWKYQCPKCKKVILSHLHCPECNFTNMQKIDPPLVRVNFYGHIIPVFPFAEVIK